MDRRDTPHRVGLVLSGGGARGFAHIGVLRVLERHAIAPHVIAGTSMGAILGALYAAGTRADELYAIAEELSWRELIDLSLSAGLLKGEKLRAFLEDHLPDTFEELDVPLAVTTTDVETGEQVVFLEGPLVPAVRASACYPGAFEPVTIQGRTLADGGIVNNLPVEAAAILQATFTIASDVTPPRRTGYVSPAEEGSWWERMLATVRLERRNPMVQMLLRGSDIMQALLTDIQYTLHPADVRIRLAMPEIRVESFRDFRAIVRHGEEAAAAALQQPGVLDELRRVAGQPQLAEPAQRG
jgi:NTE family protein